MFNFQYWLRVVYIQHYPNDIQFGTVFDYLDPTTVRVKMDSGIVKIAPESFFMSEQDFLYKHAMGAIP